jgi:hypothetical protein
MKPALDQLQQDFQDFILDPNGTNGVALHIAERPGLATSERLSIYHNGYRIRLREALSEAYEKTHSYLGDDLFYDACNGYIEKHPSHQRSLRWYGDRFASFLGEQLRDFPAVAELAAFEWALGLAFDAADQPVLTLEQCRQFSAADWATISFDCQASVQFSQLRWNSVAIWLGLNEEQTPPAMEACESSVPWLIWRKNQQAHFRSLSVEEHQALLGLQAGSSFAEVCAIAATSNPDATTQIAGWLQTWINEEVLLG